MDWMRTRNPIEMQHCTEPVFISQNQAKIEGAKLLVNQMKIEGFLLEDAISEAEVIQMMYRALGVDLERFALETLYLEKLRESIAKLERNRDRKVRDCQVIVEG